MSLATRCSACSTVFRVQKDQLKASEGWVRCGRCGTVFSALEGLFDLEREAHSGPMPLQPAAPSPAPTPPAPVAAPAASAAMAAAAATAPSSRLVEADDDGGESTIAADNTVLDLAHDDEAADRAAAAASFGVSRPHPGEGADADDEDEAALSILEHSGSHTLDESRPAGDSGPVSLTHNSSLLPSFAREPDAVLQWRKQRPVVRRLTIAAALVLPLVLLLQVVLHHRDLVAARWPASTDLLRALCAPLKCELQPPLALESLTVESSGLSRVEGTPLYRFQVAVRNRSPWPVAMPTLDLTLTDTRGEVVSRRVLRPADLGASAPRELAAGAEWSALATLDVGERRVSGYTIDLFYP